MENVFLSIGHGYAARYTADALGEGWTVVGTSRTPGRAAVAWPEDARAALESATHLISWVAPSAEGDPILNVIREMPAPNLRWVGYASASSVYGDTDGAWIDDEAPDAPSTTRGHLRLKAENDWKNWCSTRNIPLARFRIAGIYGPGRSVFDALREGRAKRVIKPGQVFNRIHVVDLGRAIAAAMVAKAEGRFILSDSEPAPLAEVTAYGAQLMGVDAPPEVDFHTADLSPMARSFYAENKRLHARRIADELGVTLTYPTYRDGLRAILEAERHAVADKATSR